MSGIRGHGAAALVVLGLAGCFGAKPRPGGCQTNADCGLGGACFQEECTKPCSSHAECADGLSCLSGVCQDTGPGGNGGTGNTGGTGNVGGTGGEVLVPPQLTAVSGNDPEDAFAVHNGLLLEGQNLATATFDMRIGAGTPLVLSVPLQSDTLAELLLPPDVASGTYTLTATNAAGSDTATVTLELPLMDGDTTIALMNSGTTTATIDLARQEPQPFASYRGYVPTASVAFSNTYYGVIDPETHFAYGGITESGGDISIPRAGVYTVTAVAHLSLQSNANGSLIVTRLDSGGGQISRVYLNNNNKSAGGTWTALAGTTTLQLAAGDRIRFEVASSGNTGSWYVLGRGAATSAETVVTVHLVHAQ